MNGTRTRGLRGWMRWVWACAAALGALAAMAAPPPNVNIAAAPAWVKAVPVPSIDPLPKDHANSGAVRYLLVDDQLRFTGGQRSEYRRVVSQALGPQGIEQIGNLSFDFNPEYQTLTIHHLQVRRGGRVVSHLDRARIKVLQREGGLDELMFDGRLTASVVLDDIREGDVVDYAFSREGANPVFGGRHFGGLDLQWGVPVLERHARLIWPQGRSLHWRGLRGAQVPVGRAEGDTTVYTVSLQKVPALLTETDTPSWHDPFPALQFSEFADWSAVAAWALPLYAVPAKPGPLLSKEIERLKQQAKTPEHRLRLALRFVQDEIRYLGFEMGVNSHHPHDPEWVLTRRFGDCKDKTLLVLALLNGLGIEARAALVHSTWRQGIAQLQPSPGAFNHVLVQAQLGERALWLDPTRTDQGGDRADDWVQSDFGLALPVDRATRELIPMAGPSARTHHRDVHALMDLRGGRERPVELTLTTVTHGAAAEALRSALVSTGRAKLRKQYEEFYARSYPSLVSAGDLEINDERSANRLTMVERYRIPAYWQLNDERTRFHGDVAVPDLDERTRAPTRTERREPLAMGNRLDLRLTTEVRLPSGWQFKPNDLEVKADTFHWERQIRFADDTLTLKDRLRTLADEVPADQVARHAELLSQVRRQTGYGLYDTDGAPVAEAAPASKPASADAAATWREGDDNPHWVPAVAVTLASVALLLALPRVWRWNPAPRPIRRPGAPVGVGGWLAFGTFMLAVSTAVSAHGLWQQASIYTHAEWLRWGQRVAAGEMAVGLRAYLLFELVAQLLLTAGLLLAVVLVLKRRSAAAPVAIATALGMAVVALGGRLAMWGLPEFAQAETTREAAQAWRGLVASLLWAAYFWRSDRVRGTLVRPYAAPTPVQTHTGAEAPTDSPAEPAAGPSSPVAAQG
jgi:hypothetical protein